MIAAFLLLSCVALICIGVARLYVWVLDWRDARRFARFRAAQLLAAHAISPGCMPGRCYCRHSCIAMLMEPRA